eukprot:COSAG02_NODE_875_length_16279_cov_199.143078_12_plen_332_part_00
MWDAENDDDAAFERRMASVVREIGERGKLIVAESVPPVRTGERAPTPAPAPEPARALAPAPARAPAAVPAAGAAAPAAMFPRTNAGLDCPSASPQSALASQQSGTEVVRPGTVLSVEQQPLATQQVNSSASFVASGTGTSLMEVSAFMTEQVKAQMEQRVHDNEQHAEMVRLLMARETKLEAQVEAQRKELVAQRKELEAQRKEFEAQRKELDAKLEAKLDAQRQGCEIKLEAQRKEFEAQRKELEAKTQAQSRTDKLTALQLRLEVLSDSKLLEDDELAAIEDKIADAIGVAGVDDGSESAWDCVMQMIRLSEGVASEKMFARQLRRKYL